MPEGWVEWLGKKRRRMPRYPLIDMMVHHKGTLTEFTDRTGISYATYKGIQSGKHEPTKPGIDAILRYTGLTYEQAFEEGRKEF